jgi:hypothetical protein
MNEYPLLFTIREVIEGSGFVAGVVCNGRALMASEGEDGWHASGVEPGALSELGGTPHEAYFHFRQAFSDSLRVLATDSEDFAGFEKRVRQWCGHVDREEEQRWLQARKQVQAGAETDAPFKQLPKETAEAPRGVVVVRLDVPQGQPEQRKVAHQIAQPEQVVISTPRRAA